MLSGSFLRKRTKACAPVSEAISCKTQSDEQVPPSCRLSKALEILAFLNMELHSQRSVINATVLRMTYMSSLVYIHTYKIVTCCYGASDTHNKCVFVYNRRNMSAETWAISVMNTAGRLGYRMADKPTNIQTGRKTDRSKFYVDVPQAILSFLKRYISNTTNTSALILAQKWSLAIGLEGTHNQHIII